MKIKGGAVSVREGAGAGYFKACRRLLENCARLAVGSELNQTFKSNFLPLLFLTADVFFPPLKFARFGRRRRRRREQPTKDVDEKIPETGGRPPKSGMTRDVDILQDVWV